MTIDATERERRRRLLHAHYKAENDHHLDGTMKTFGAAAEMSYNRQIFADHDSIQGAHAYMGFSGAGAFERLHNSIDVEHFTDDEIVVEGTMSGRHVAEFQGFAPTGKEVKMPFVAFYRFDAGGKLVSERVVMNLGALNPSSLLS